ncbi:electron transfer flavoprotein beta subunit lysine methyltransferase-like [Condylostylus longicornis]|uniref:electron transfer flavoprotein beta subunit lysine methyltransferase-like n=1 Tax=Condylostylus longicornis TaxID=2530218 RepID=UPI00244E4B7E|nr:electron transfer flavoprotein beta subunit lysine methyltransferase-like [Condylostylus longicornis]
MEKMFSKNFINIPKYCMKSSGKLWCSSSFRSTIREKILNNTEITNTHLTPEISLRLITPNCKIYHEPVILQKDRVFENDPFWGFYWPGGQALSRFILDNPLMVKSKRVLDIGSGSGACSIAAMISGAKSCIANDIDKIAEIAIELNAELNNVKLRSCTKNIIGKECDADVILLGDIFYDEDIACLIVPWLFHLRTLKKKIFIGDPGRHPMTSERLTYMKKLSTYELSKISLSENHGFDVANVWEWIGCK